MPLPRCLAARPLAALVLALALAASVDAQEAEPLRFAPDRPIDVTRIDLDLRVDLEAKLIEGNATLTLTALTALERFALDAVDLELQGVEALDERAAASALPYDYDGQRLWIARRLARGDALRVRVRYKVIDPNDGLHFFAPTPEAPATPRQVWSQGEPRSNRRWFPCLDHPDERQVTSLTAHVAPGLQVISNGVLLEKRARPDGLVTWRYEQAREHVAYLVTLVVGTFAEVRPEPWRGKVPLAYYVPPARRADAERSFSRTPEMLDLFSKLTGVDYPWSKYEQVVVEQFTAGGMENTGATTLNERTLHDERAHLDYSSEGLVAHELAHQWYGDLLTCRDWAHIWLNESFATYFDALWVEHSQGADAYAYELFQNAESGLPAGKTRPIVDRRYPNPDSVFDGRAYPKGSCVLHMLRRQLGEDAFWRGLQSYTRSLQDRSVETSDLRRALEAESGRNLERFFLQWLERPGHPVLDVRYERDAERGLLLVTITQRQEGEAYEFPAELLFRFGEREVRHVLEVKAKQERFVLASAEAPSYFRFDPRQALLLKELTVHQGRDLWLALLRQGDLVGRIRAARHLARDAAPEAQRALSEAASQEPAWQVRRELALALRSASGGPAREALLRALADGSPQVRQAAAESLGARGADPGVAAAAAERLRKGEPSYYVTAALTRALPKLGGDPRELLLAALEQPSHNDVIQIAALEALRELDDPSLAPRFLPFLSPDRRGRLRGAAARALNVVALPGTDPALVKTTLGALRPLLADRSRWQRETALSVFEAVGQAASEHLGEIDRLAETDPEEGVRERAKRTAERIRAAAPPSEQLRVLREQVRKLEEDRSALSERVRKLEEELRARRGAPAEGEKRGPF